MFGNGRAVTIPLFFFVYFDNNIGPFIRLLIVLNSYLLYREPSEKIIYQNPEHSISSSTPSLEHSFILHLSQILGLEGEQSFPIKSATYTIIDNMHMHMHMR